MIIEEMKALDAKLDAADVPDNEYELMLIEYRHLEELNATRIEAAKGRLGVLKTTFVDSGIENASQTKPFSKMEGRDTMVCCEFWEHAAGSAQLLADYENYW